MILSHCHPHSIVTTYYFLKVFTTYLILALTVVGSPTKYLYEFLVSPILAK